MTIAWRMTRSVLALAALAGGCDGVAPVLCDGGACGTQVSTRGRIQATYTRQLDLLFVVDDTPAIAPHLDAVATGLAAMAPALTGAREPYSLHVGFIRGGGCDTSTRGAVCGLAAPDEFLTSEWCNTIRNQTGALADTFACLGDFGIGSCDLAQPLWATVGALTTSPPQGWDGFLRPDAYLMIVIVAATDDASGEPGAPMSVVATAALIKRLKPDPSQVLVSTIGPNSCALGEVPAPRLTEFVQQFGANGLLIPLCDGQFPTALQRVTEFINDRLLPPCLRNVRDTDLATPGLQADCSVEDRARAPDGSYATSRLPSCEEAAPPCWRLTPGAAINCAGPGTTSGWIFSVERPSDWCYEAGTNLTIECLGCADANDPACAAQ